MLKLSISWFVQKCYSWNGLSSFAALEMLQDIVGAWAEDEKLMLFYIANNFLFMNDTLEKGKIFLAP